MPSSSNRRLIDWPAAHQATLAAVEYARSKGWVVNVAVVDSAGTLAAFLRMPGAALHSIDIAIDKAYTATSFGRPTSQWSQVLGNSSPAVRQGLVHRPRFVIFGGGVPILEDGVNIGGIGVSGASESEDEEIARAALKAIGL